MNNAPSGRQLEMLQRSDREESRDRRTIMKVNIAASMVLIVTTLMAWENHPRVVFRNGPHPGYFVVEVGHSIGLATRPAGLIIFAVAVLALIVANWLRTVHLFVGWFLFVLSWGAVGTCLVEMIQLLFGRRNWLGHLASNVGASTLGEAIGGGVWLAGLASVALAVNASTYVWLRHQLWREHSS